MNAEQMKAVEEMLRKRLSHVRGKKTRAKAELEFLMGACAVSEVVYGSMPPKWIIYPMTGRSVLND
jgi:hypothetical protein